MYVVCFSPPSPLPPHTITLPFLHKPLTFYPPSYLSVFNLRSSTDDFTRDNIKVQITQKILVGRGSGVLNIGKPSGIA